MSISILVADDHAVCREGLCMLIETQADMRVVAQAENGRQAVRLAAQLDPDVILMDVAMPELNGLEAARQILAARRTARVIIFSVHSSSQHISDALQMGCCGYLMKGATSTQVTAAVRAACAGQRYLDRDIPQVVIEHSLERLQSPTNTGSPLARLTPREREFLQLVVEGYTSAEIAQLYRLSSRTIAAYRSTLMKKLEIDDLASLVKFALKHGLTTLG